MPESDEEGLLRIRSEINVQRAPNEEVANVGVLKCTIPIHEIKPKMRLDLTSPHLESFTTKSDGKFQV